MAWNTPQTTSEGSIGPQGPQGPQGPTGLTGATGAVGAAGADGVDGVGLLLLEADEDHTDIPGGTPTGTLIFRKIEGP